MSHPAGFQAVMSSSSSEGSNLPFSPTRGLMFPDLSDTKLFDQATYLYNRIAGPIQLDPAPPTILTPDEANYDGNFHYHYDETAYIHDVSLRFKDSILVATEIDKLWQRFVDAHKPDLNYPDVPFGEAFGGVRRCLQYLHTPEEIFLNYFRLSQIATPSSATIWLRTSLQVVIPFFSHLKAYLHVNIDRLPPVAYMYSEMDTIAGYPKNEHRALTDDPRQWLTVDVPDQHDAEWWASSIAYLLQSNIVKPTRPLMNFLQFVESPWLWVTSGASSNSSLMLGDKKIRTKFGAAVSLTPQQLLACVLHAIDPHSVNIDIFLKQDERGFKRRIIANMDLGSYLIAAYIRYLLEYINGPMPRWMTAKTTPTLDLSVIQLLRTNNRAMPLDESQFDHHLSRDAWMGFIKALKYLFPDNLGVSLFDCLFSNSTYYQPETGLGGRWRKGMPSGLAITSIGNTLFNAVKQQAIISPVHFALGDDVLLFPEGYTIAQISDYYATYGAEVNVKKNWESNTHAEYLHFLYNKHGRTGLPARMYGSLMYGIRFDDATPLSRLYELATMWKDFFDRACLMFDESLVAADLARAVSKRWAGFSAATARTWLHIPKALQGFGLLPYQPYQFKVTNNQTKTEVYHNARISLPPVITVLSSAFEIRPFKYMKSNFKLGSTLRMPPISSMQEWEDRLNLKADGYTSTMVQWADATIPLPEIPFVSSTRMSSFATMWRFNAFPNVSGSAAARTSRFISASYALADMVGSWLKKHHIYVYV